MKRIIFGLLLSISSLSHAQSPEYSEVFTHATLDKGMSVESYGYRFEIVQTQDNIFLSAKSPSGATKKVELGEAGFSNIERLFFVYSNGCDSNSIDAVIQIGPPKYADLQYRNYYRVVFSTDLRTVISKFYDPSVPELYAVLPIQSVENVKNKETNRAIICEGSKPVVKELAASGAKNKDAPPLGKVILQDKAPLYTSPSQNSITKSYLVKGDNVSLTTKEINGFFKFKYKAKSGKIIENWIQCESIASCSKDSSNSDK